VGKESMLRQDQYARHVMLNVLHVLELQIMTVYHATQVGDI
jgi:hypothetical protein